MLLISFTNIVVDEFNYGRSNPFAKYIYFLTHMHSGKLLFKSIYNKIIILV